MEIKQSHSIGLFILISIIGMISVCAFLFNMNPEAPKRTQELKNKESLASVIGELTPRKYELASVVSSSRVEEKYTDPKRVEEQVIEETVTEISVSVEPEIEFTFQDFLALQAEKRTRSNVVYDGSYRKIDYPMGDVPENIGVCTDVVIRSYRAMGIDLQKLVHEDMKGDFKSYPQKWNLKRPDTNIDHRRVPNLMTYFKRAGGELAISKDPIDYEKGNIVAWDLGKGLLHIGIVSTYVSEITGNPLIVHNIGKGPEMNDILFEYEIIGHYKYASLDSKEVREVVGSLP